MAMDSERFAIRFGYGLPAGAGPEAMLAGLTGPDQAMADWPGLTLDELWPLFTEVREARRAKDKAALPKLARQANGFALRGLQAGFARAIGSTDPLRERLVAFWADHFTTAPRNQIERVLPGLLQDAAIRPHVAGRFADMLQAVITHPGMLVYLDQAASFGPGSRRGKRRDKGLNENLARELLELHTLGVSAGYTQTDVSELAKLLTGLTIRTGRGFVFDQGQAEPGSETVLGVTYGDSGIEPVLQVLEDLSLRPETAAHLARKLAVHFVADDPPPTLVEALAARWRDTGGDLLAVTETLVLHPLAAEATAQKVRQPYDFLVAALRALQVSPETVLTSGLRSVQMLILKPLEAMGQPYQQAPGPDGWSEAAADWITPQGLAARIDWAMAAPERLARPLPDPRAFLERALGSQAGDTLRWAVSAAESARDGVGLVLASPEFNRR